MWLHSCYAPFSPYTNAHVRTFPTLAAMFAREWTVVADTIYQSDVRSGLPQGSQGSAGDVLKCRVAR